MRTHSLIPLALSTLALAHSAAFAQDSTPLDWKSLEAGVMRNHVQLTTRDMFAKAGEAYFSPGSDWIIFQATPAPAAGQQPDPFYQMYVAKLVRTNGRVTGIETPIQISPPGSANTCGWFHPLAPYKVLFSSTITPPKASEAPGFRVGENRYVWEFPPEMEIVTRSITQIYDSFLAPGVTVTNNHFAPDVDTPMPIMRRPGYDAEASWSPDGKYILFTRVPAPAEGAASEEPDGDIYLLDPSMKQELPLVTAKGYDGGPFFSPDGTMICYRSDRKGDDKLQIFVARLQFGFDGRPSSITQETQLTSDDNVNWAPFWHPSGRWLIYASSASGHRNYELYAVQVALGTPAAQLKNVRISHADGADILPAFNRDGSLLMWTSQRGGKAPGDERPSSQLWIAEFTGDPMK